MGYTNILFCWSPLTILDHNLIFWLNIWPVNWGVFARSDLCSGPGIFTLGTWKALYHHQSQIESAINTVFLFLNAFSYGSKKCGFFYRCRLDDYYSIPKFSYFLRSDQIRAMSIALLWNAFLLPRCELHVMCMFSLGCFLSSTTTSSY